MQNPLIQTLLNNLKIKNPQGHQIIQNLMQNNGNPQAILQQMMGNATPEQMLFTLKHELMHVWLYENGHVEQDNKKRFDYEDICEYVALSNNSINNVVELYLKSCIMLNGMI